jgi:tagaturonate reductase
MNPFLNHQLVSIALNSISKWRARVLPSFKDYYTKYGKIAPNLTIGFSYLMALYSSIQKQGDKYIVKVKNREIEIKDDLSYLEYFIGGGSIVAFMSDISVWGEELTSYKDFAKVVEENVEKIKKGICLI